MKNIIVSAAIVIIVLFLLTACNSYRYEETTERVILEQPVVQGNNTQGNQGK